MTLNSVPVQSGDRLFSPLFTVLDPGYSDLIGLWKSCRLSGSDRVAVRIEMPSASTSADSGLHGQVGVGPRWDQSTQRDLAGVPGTSKEFRSLRQ